MTVGKKLSRQAVIGAQGVNLIERTVLAMGCAWHPTNQSLESGIDGDIELIDPATRDAQNAIVRVQSRATIRQFAAETERSFEYVCGERELAYWLSGNAPVILIVSRPHTNEAYWVPIKEYFATAAAKKARKVRFDKQTMRFTPNVLQDIARLALPRTQGVYLAPPPREEKLYSNLLSVTRIPESLWYADTTVRRAEDVFRLLRNSGVEAPEFALKYKRILSAHDLSESPWNQIVDKGTVEEFSADEWSDSADPDKRRLFVELLNYCLTQRTRHMRIGRRRDDDALFFLASEDLQPRHVPFRSVKQTTERTVFQSYPYLKGDRKGDIAYYRHAACHVQFRRYDETWFLELLPTYHYTSDGKWQHPLSEKYLAEMKRLERQGAVLYQVVMWAAILSAGIDSPSPEYPFLGFGTLQSFDLDVGIDDKSWLPNEDAATTQLGEQTMGDLPLFGDTHQSNPEPNASED